MMMEKPWLCGQEARLRATFSFFSIFISLENDPALVGQGGRGTRLSNSGRLGVSTVGYDLQEARAQGYEVTITRR